RRTIAGLTAYLTVTSLRAIAIGLWLSRTLATRITSPFRISDGDVKGLTVTTASTVTISGELVWDTNPPELPFKPDLAVMPSPWPTSLPNIRSGVPGSFSFDA